MRENLKAARKAMGLTQQEVADELGISSIHYQKIEAGDRTGDVTIWDKLEDIMCVHQRVLREISATRPGKEDNRGKRQECPQS